ncbi:hypothetical protein H6F50_21295 [Coleofasciculus sp. FACHB-712]|uniref:hypothetical protein n=1 Tax=Coleofasciculus sp. FACHB-712 TaxID=2692789 RepID=UPI001686E9BA|nr:hypothetical protein [Coleofasciculus sp. FACHB-712]MBD1944862.1 hypothetical protein [Coleofasciculus sp. FACHB-712]
MPGKKDDPNYQIVRGHVPKELVKRFKIYCVENGVDNSQGLEDILTEYLQAKEQQPLRKEASPQPPPQTIAELVQQNYVQLLERGGVEVDRLKALKDGAKPTVRELAFLARDLYIDEEIIVELRDRSFPKNKKREANGV